MLWESPCVPTLWNVCNQLCVISPTEWRNITCRVTRELKCASGTSNVSFYVFSKRSVWNVSVLFTVVWLSVTINSKCRATDSTWDCVSFSTRADFSRVNAHGRCVVCLGEEQHSQLSREQIVHRSPVNAPLMLGTLQGVCPCLRSLWFLSRCCWGMAAIWFAGITFKSTFFFSFWVRALGCSYLPPRRLMLLSFLWMNWVLAISIFCIWKAYCILDRSFSLP